MKYFILLTLTFIFFISFKVSGQYVDIPDSNFRSFLKNSYPNCFNSANQMDTTCDSVLQIQTIDCSNKNISSIDGIQYFKNLNSLNCSHNNLTRVPFINSNYLQEFDCSFNQITSLPSFSHLNGFDVFSCRNNLLTSLPPLPKGSIVDLACQFNNITCLPADLPMIEFVLNIDSSISCVSLRDYYQVFQVNIFGKISSSGGTWGRVDGLGQPIPINYPICDPTNNINGCRLSTSKINGTIYYDNNSNGIMDAGEPYADNVGINLTSGEKVFSSYNGTYWMETAALGNDTLYANAPNYFKANPGNAYLSLSGNDTTITQYFGLQPIQTKDSLDINIISDIAARPGRIYQCIIEYKNTGTTTLSPLVTIKYDASKLSFDSSNNSLAGNNTNSVVLPVGSFVPGEAGNWYVYFKVNSNAVSGDSLVTIATIADGAVSSTDSSKVAISSSFDPNNKMATPALSLEQISKGNFITYTIHFQNTGNDTAFNVVVSDTLSSNLQNSTIEIISSSLPCRASLINGIVYFEFLGINLPDSNVSEFGSKGFVTFKINAVKTLNLNDSVFNKAYIFFDYNKPVATNISTTLIRETPTPLQLISFSANISGNKLLLNWLTNNEINTKNFDIQKSYDGVSFFKRGNVIAKGTGTGRYNFTTSLPAQAITYYRLKLNDFNGTSSYSDIIKVQLQQEFQGLIVVNPAKDVLVINVTDDKLIGTKAILINSEGQTIKEIILQSNIQTTSIRSLPMGNYYLKTNEGSVKLIVL